MKSFRIKSARSLCRRLGRYYLGVNSFGLMTPRTSIQHFTRIRVAVMQYINSKNEYAHSASSNLDEDVLLSYNKSLRPDFCPP